MTLSRRTFLAGLVASASLARMGSALAHSSAGVVEPASAPPNLDLTLDAGTATRMQKVLAGKVTALQLMFTSCSATCPIQGALFAQAARQLGDRIPDAQWISLSIDPTRDSIKALHAWLERHGAHPRWHAARPELRELDRFVDFLKARSEGADRHTAQVYFFNRRGQLAMRSVDFPPASELVRVLEALSKQR
jgi:protein SCO1/2